MDWEDKVESWIWQFIFLMNFCKPEDFPGDKSSTRFLFWGSSWNFVSIENLAQAVRSGDSSANLSRQFVAAG